MCFQTDAISVLIAGITKRIDIERGVYVCI